MAMDSQMQCKQAEILGSASPCGECRTGERPFVDVTVRLSKSDLDAMMAFTKAESAASAVRQAARHGLWIFERVGKALDALVVPSPVAPNNPTVSEPQSGAQPFSDDKFRSWCRSEQAVMRGISNVSDEEISEFLDYLKCKGWKNSRGVNISQSNVFTTFSSWREIRRRAERAELRREEARAKEARESEERAFARNLSRLSEVEEI